MKKYLLTILAACSLTLLGNMAFAVIPNFSYTTPNVYPIGSPVTLAPTVTTAAAALTYAAGTGFTGGALGQPWDMDIDNAGNIYVADYSNQRIRKFTGTASVGNFGTGIPNATTSYTPVAIAFDPTNGTPYILDGNNGGGNGKVLKLTTAGAYVSTLITGINTPRGLAVDAVGNIYVTDADATPTVTKYNSAGVVQFTITANLNGPDQIAIDPNNGNIYVANRGGNNILQYNSAGTYIGIFKGGLNGPYSVAVDAIGNVYVANTGASIVNVYNTAGTLLGSRTVSVAVRGLVIDASDDIIVSDITAGTVTKYAPTGGYHLTTGTLPAGLTFNSSTGTISGTPTAVFPTTNFRVTAYNASGTGQSNIFTIQCVAPAPTISYPLSSYTFTVATPISTLTPTVTNSPTSYSISPNLTTNTGLTFNTSTGTISGTPTTASGAVLYTVTANNAGGSGTTTITITVNNPAPPIITYSSPVTYVVGTAYTSNPTNTGGAVQASGGYSVSPALPAGLSINTTTGVISGTPTTATAAANYTVTAINAGGSGTFPVNITVNNPSAPVITYTSPVTYIVGTAYTSNPTNTGGTVQATGGYSVSPALPAGLSLNTTTGVISGTPTTVTAAADYTVTATNAGGSGTFPVNITVNPKLPALTYTTPDVYTDGVTITPLNPNNTGGPVDTYAVSPALPTGLSLNTTTGVISGTPSGTVTAANYVVTATNITGNGTATINITVNPPKPIISYATPQTYMVGTAITTLSVTSTGGPITSFSVAPALPGGLSLNTTTGDITGTPTVAATAANYVVTATNPGGTGTSTINITVLPKPPGFTYTNPAAITYGGSVSVTPANSGGPSTSCTISPTTGGIVVSAAGVVSGTPNAAGTATYTITATNAGGTTTSTVTITTNQKALTITAVNKTKTYGAANPALTVTYAGFITGESSANLTTQPTITTTATNTSSVGSYPITASGAVDNNYSISYVAGSLSVTAAALTINANLVNKTYGTLLSTTPGSTAFTSTGLQNGETITVTMTYGTGAAANALVGTYTNQVFPSLAVTTIGGTFLASNYTITYNRANIVVGKANLTITANDVTKTYGTQLNNQNNSTAFTSTGLQNGETVGRVNIAYGTGSAQGAAVGTYANQVTASAAAGGTFAAGNYNITYAAGDITVNPANLTITANSQTRDVGINTALTVSYSGFVNGEDNTDLTTQPTVTTTATVASPPGVYPITASGAVDANYNISYVAGTLTITPAGTHSYTWDWLGGTTTWETPSNWSINGITQTTNFPGSNSLIDKVQMGVNAIFTATKSPIISTPITITSVSVGSNNGSGAISLTANSPLIVNGNIGVASDNNSGGSQTFNLKGSSSINATSITVDDVFNFNFNFTVSLNSSVNTLNITSNVTLSTTAFLFFAENSAFNLTGGTATIGGTLRSNNDDFFSIPSTSSFTVSAATLILTNAAAISGLDNSGNNVVSFNNTNATVQYSGAGAQTIYTDAGITGLNTGPSYRNLIIGGTGVKTPNGAATNSLNIAGDFTNSLANDATNYVTLTNTAVTFNGTSAQAASQTLNGGVGTGTIFKNVNFNGNNTKLMSSGTFTVNSAGTLSMLGTTSNSILNANGLLTLNSDATSTATVAAFTGSKITGNVNVQRFVTGGLNPQYRGYRLFSSPVNANGIINATGGIVDLSYLNNGTGQNAITTAGPGGPANGFTTANTNPLIYLYDVTRASNNRVFVGGKNVGVTAIAGSAGSYNLHLSVALGVDTTTTAVLPVGNSWLLYYVGSTTSTAISGTGRPLPDDATTTAVGTLNQGTIPVKFWTYTGTGSATIPYSVGHGDATGTNGNAGLNQVGNPYPSTINLDNLYSHTSGLIWPTFYELDDRLGTYVAYVSGGGTSTTRVSKYVVSGQGFLINSRAVGKTNFTFLETDKTAYPANFLSSNTTSPALVMSMPGGPSVKNTDMIASASLASSQTTAATPPKDTTTLIGLHLQLAKDSTVDTQTGIYFNNKWTDAYEINHDALDMDGTSPKVYLSSYSADGKRLCVNGLGDYSKGKRVKLYAYGTTNGTFNISLVDIHNIDTNAYNVFLVDHKMNDSLDMVKYRSYAFNINTADTTTFGANRFTLVIERHPVPPYVLVNFSGQKVTNGVQLIWKTLNEGTYTGFALQKLGGSNTYSSIYTVQGSGAGLYSYVDQHPASGNNTYRLQQTDIDGRVTYSASVTINYNSRSPNGSLTVYPNPSRSIIHIGLNNNGPGLSNYLVDIYNISGTIVDHRSVNTNSWTQDISSYKLGVYVIEIKTNNGYLVGKSKFVKVN